MKRILRALCSAAGKIEIGKGHQVSSSIQIVDGHVDRIRITAISVVIFDGRRCQGRRHSRFRDGVGLINPVVAILKPQTGRAAMVRRHFRSLV